MPTHAPRQPPVSLILDVRQNEMHFYATHGDLIPVIREIESKSHFTYSLCGLHEIRQYPFYTSALDIPSLGRATKDSAINCDAFLVTPSNIQVAVREVRQNAGGVCYAIDQLHNPTSITFQPGGIFGEEVLLHGRVVTCSPTKESKNILGAFERQFKKLFTKRMAFYVGPEAIRLKERGMRLTISVQSPAEFSLL